MSGKRPVLGEKVAVRVPTGLADDEVVLVGLLLGQSSGMSRIEAEEAKHRVRLADGSLLWVDEDRLEPVERADPPRRASSDDASHR